MSKNTKKGAAKATSSTATETNAEEVKTTKANKSEKVYEVYNGLGEFVKEFTNKEEADAYAELYRFEVR